MLMASPLSVSSSPLPRTLPKPYKTSIPEKSLSPPNASHFKKSKSSQIPSSLSGNRPLPVADAAAIPPNFASGTAFLSSVLAALVWILESSRKQPLLLPHRIINRRRHDLRRGSVVVGSWKLKLDVLPSIREAYDRPATIIDPAFLGIAKAAERMALRTPESEGRSELDENAAGRGIVKAENHAESGFLGIVKSADPLAAGIQKSCRHPEVVTDPPSGGIVKSSDYTAFGICPEVVTDPLPFGGIVKSSDYPAFGICPEVVTDPPPIGGIVKSSEYPASGICKSYQHPEVDIDLALLGNVRLLDLDSSGSSDCRNCRALVPVNTSLKQPVDSSGAGGIGLDGSGRSGSVRSQLMLPVGTATCPEAPLSGAVSVTEEDKLPTQRELKSVIPAIAMAAGSFGAVTAGVNGGLEMIGFTAVIIFLVRDLLWDSNRRMLWEDLIKVTDREKFVSFLKSRNIVPTE